MMYLVVWIGPLVAVLPVVDEPLLDTIVPNTLDIRHRQRRGLLYQI